MTPRIIHQTWKTDAIPPEFTSYRDSWLAHHPDWEYRLWTDEENERLVEEHYPWLLETYRAYPFVIQKTDMARVLYLHQFGGLYVDLDFECLKPLDELLDQHQVVLGREYRGAGHFRFGRDLACNALMASTPRHPFWQQLLEGMVREFRPPRRRENKGWYILSTTGPQMLNAEVLDYSAEHDDLIVYPREYFYASPWSESNPAVRRRYAERCDSYAIHHFSGSWQSMTRRWIRRLDRWHNRVREIFRKNRGAIERPK